MSAIKDLAETVIERLPYADGNGRRRMLAGGVLLLGILIPNWSSLHETFALDPVQILRSPLLIGFVALAVYLAGSLLELFGALFLVRAAAGLLNAFDVFVARPEPRSRLKRMGAILLTPFRAMWGVLCGFLGFGSVNLRLEASLSCHAHEVVRQFPPKVVLGLENPIGDYGPLAEFYLLHEIKSPSTRKWARRQLTRVADIAVSTTALIAAMVPSYAVALRSIPQSNAPAHYWEAMTKFNADLQRIERAEPRLSRLLEQVNLSDFARGIEEAGQPIWDELDARDRGQYVRYLRVGELTRLSEFIEGGKKELITQTGVATEVERPGLERQIASARDGGATGHGIALTTLSRLDEIASSVDEFTIAAANVEAYHRQVTTVAIVGGIGIFMLLLLYRGFFMSSRNAILSILETVAIESADAVRIPVRPQGTEILEHQL